MTKRRSDLETCIKQFNNTMNNTIDVSLPNFNEYQSLQENLFYKNCSEELLQSRLVSPAQEYFQ